MKEETQKLHVKKDFISSLIICIVSLITLILSLKMPKYEEWGLYATPSLAPIAFSTILFFCGLMMLVRSIRAKGYQITVTKDEVMTFITAPITRHFIVALSLVLLFYFLFAVVQFVVVSTVYLFLNILYFKSTVWWKNLLISLGVSVIVYALFTYVFFMPLP